MQNNGHWPYVSDLAGTFSKAKYIFEKEPARFELLG